MSDATPVSLPRIGDTAPDFTAVTTHGELTFSAWQGDSWAVLFSHPADFTPVCSTELTELAKLQDEFSRRHAKLIGISIDSIHSHLAWVENLKSILGVALPYPLIADSHSKVAEKYGMIHPGESSTVTVRALFFIDPKRVIRAIIYYPLNVGRNTAGGGARAGRAADFGCQLRRLSGQLDAGRQGHRPGPEVRGGCRGAQEDGRRRAARLLLGEEVAVGAAARRGAAAWGHRAAAFAFAGRCARLDGLPPASSSPVRR